MATATEQALINQGLMDLDFETGINPVMDINFSTALYPIHTATNPDYSRQNAPGGIPQDIFNTLRDNHYFPQPIPSQLDLDRARHENMVAAYGTPQMDIFSKEAEDADAIREIAIAQASAPDRVALEKTQEVEEDYNKMQHLDIVYGTGARMSSLPGTVPDFWGALRESMAKRSGKMASISDIKEGFKEQLKYGAGLARSFFDTELPSMSEPIRSSALKFEDNIPKVNKALATNESVGDISDSIRDLVMNQVYEEAKDAGLTPEQAYVLPNVPDDRRDFEGFTKLLLDSRVGPNKLTQEHIDEFASGGGDRTLQSFTEPGGGFWNNNPGLLPGVGRSVNRRDEMAQRYEQAFVNPEQYDLTPFTLSQRRSALEDIKTGIEEPEGMWSRIGQRVRDRIADLIPEAEASIARDVEFERKREPEPTWFPPTTSSGVVVVESPQQADTEPGDKYSGKVVLPPEPKKETKPEPARESSKDREAREAREAASRVVKIHEDTAKRIKDEAKKSGDKTLQADDKKAIARANAAAERAKKKEDDLMKKQLDDMMKAAERQRNANRVLSTFVDPWAFEDRRGGRR